MRALGRLDWPKGEPENGGRDREGLTPCAPGGEFATMPERMAEEHDNARGAFIEPSFGEELRRQRELKGMSVREIADRTKISARFLEALEHDDYGSLPAAVFTRGFIREYAREIGVDGEELVSRYMRLVRAEESKEEQELAEMQRRIEGGSALRKWLVPLASLALLLIVVSVFWFGRGKRGGDSETIPAPAEPVVESEAEPPREAAPAAEESPIRIEVVARESSWISLDADGETLLEGILAAGETRRFTAEDRIQVSLGNAGGVSITINGVRLEPLGRTGQVVRDRVFDRSFVDQLRAEGTETDGG